MIVMVQFSNWSVTWSKVLAGLTMHGKALDMVMEVGNQGIASCHTHVTAFCNSKSDVTTSNT